MAFRIRTVDITASGREIVRERDVAGDALTVGRAADNAVPLFDLAVEQHHVLVTAEPPGRLHFQAAGTLGFRVNGRVTSDVTVDLAEGAELSVGSSRLLFGRAADGTVGVEIRQVADTREHGVAQRGFALASVLPGKRVLSWTGLIAILLAFLAVPIWSHTHREPMKPDIHKPGAVLMDASWSPGKLSTAHHGLEDNCEACHVQPFVAVRDNACLACHKDIADHATPARQLRARGSPHGFEAFQQQVAQVFHKPGPGACVDCHTEHEGAGRMPPTQQKFCADCHGSMDTRLPDTPLANAADFGKLHPDLQPAVLMTPGQAKPQRVSLATHPQQWDGLRFPHALHLSKTSGVARMAQRLGLQRGYGKPLDCSDCHRKTADGVRFLPVDMEKDCESCHSLVINQVGGTFRALHHGDLRQIRADLSSVDLSPGRAVSTLRRRPGEYGEGGLYSARFSQPAFNPIIGAMDRKGLCGECHFPAAGGGSLAVMKVSQPTRYLVHSWFDHQAHQQEPCASCHAAPRSSTASDLLLPNLAKCRDCHLGESASVTKPKVPSPCAMCHSYHPHGQPAALPRRIAMR